MIHLLMIHLFMIHLLMIHLFMINRVLGCTLNPVRILCVLHLEALTAYIVRLMVAALSYCQGGQAKCERSNGS